MLQVIALIIDLTFAIGLLFFGLGPLTDPNVWKYRPALIDASISTICGFLVLAVGILDFVL